MKLPAKITITAIQDNDKIEIMTDGFIEKFSEYTSIEYEVENNKTIISISKDTVSVTKFSGPAYTMVFSSKSQHAPFQVIYPGGTLYLKTKPKKVLVKNEEDKIDIYLSYSLEYESTEKIEHKLRVVCNY